MNEKDKQTLSGFLDNDIESTEAVANEDFLKKISHDTELRSLLQRYQIMGELMRGNTPPVKIELSEQIRQQIQAEPPILAPQSKAKLLHFPSWLKPAVGGAVAASLTLFVFNFVNKPPTSTELPVNFVNQPAIQATPVANNIQVNAPKTSVVMVSETQDHWITDNKELESRLNRYLIQHSENSSHVGVRNVLPYANFISYDAEE